MMSDDKGKDEISVQNLIKKHTVFENEIDNFYETVMQLGDIAKQLIAAKHPSRFLIHFFSLLKIQVTINSIIVFI